MVVRGQLLIQFNDFLSVQTIDNLAIITVIVIAAGLVYKFRMWFKVVPHTFFTDVKKYVRFTELVSLFFSELGNRVLAQRGILNDSRSRRVTHIITFWGFAGLGFATVWDDIFFNNGRLPPPFSLENIGNIVGNVAGVLVVLGITVIVLRYAFVTRFHKSVKGDVTFLFLLYLTTISGFITEFSRYSDAWFAYGNYGVHLILVAALLLTAPFTHFFHALLTPLMRYVDRVQTILIQKEAVRYPYYKKMAMASLAEDIRDGKARPTKPSWLYEASGRE